MTRPVRLDRIERGRMEEVVDVLCEAFFEYPAMRYILGTHLGDYPGRLRRLITFFCHARLARQDPVFAVIEGRTLAGVMTVVRPGSTAPASLAKMRRDLWSELGEESKRRYETFGAALERFAVEGPHYHIPMIGVRKQYLGRGLARTLLEHAHRLSCEDPESLGTTLNTESPENVSLYKHLGYQVIGHARVETIETWGLYRPD